MPRHRVAVPLRWSDVDAYGHVNNVQFLRLLEEARVMAFGRARAEHGVDLVSTGVVVGRSEIEYLLPLEFGPAPVAIDMWVTSYRAADFDLAYQVTDGEDGTLYAQAVTLMVAYDLERGVPRRLSEAELAILEGLADGPVTWRRRRSRAAAR